MLLADQSYPGLTEADFEICHHKPQMSKMKAAPPTMSIRALIQQQLPDTHLGTGSLVADWWFGMRSRPGRRQFSALVHAEQWC